jgi:Tat protein secretion system quality control protein TatD with DNase activity
LIPEEILLLESDATAENAATQPSIDAIAHKVAELRGIDFELLAVKLEENATRFLSTNA